MFSTHFVRIFGGGNDQSTVYLFHLKPPFVGSLRRVHKRVFDYSRPLLVYFLVQFGEITIPIGKVVGLSVLSMPWTNLGASPADAALFV
jgi:hypothetical protein